MFTYVDDIYYYALYYVLFVTSTSRTETQVLVKVPMTKHNTHEHVDFVN